MFFPHWKIKKFPHSSYSKGITFEKLPRTSFAFNFSSSQKIKEQQQQDERERERLDNEPANKHVWIDVGAHAAYDLHNQKLRRASPNYPPISDGSLTGPKVVAGLWVLDSSRPQTRLNPTIVAEKAQRADHHHHQYN